jgi:hypothetical protein
LLRSMVYDKKGFIVSQREVEINVKKNEVWE